MMRYQMMFQQRQLSAIVDALKFRQQLSAGNLKDTFALVAMESWWELPEVASGPYPARVGGGSAVCDVINEVCGSILRIVWEGNPPMTAFGCSPEGKLVSLLLSQIRQRSRNKRYKIIVTEGVMKEMLWAVEFEMRTRIGHFDPMIDVFYREMKIRMDEDQISARRSAIESVLAQAKMSAWQIDHCGNYGPWFSYRTRFLYDIYSVFQHELGHWRYETIIPMLPRVPLIDIKQI